MQKANIWACLNTLLSSDFYTKGINLFHLLKNYFKIFLNLK